MQDQVDPISIELTTDSKKNGMWNNDAMAQMKRLYDYLGYTSDESNPFETTFNAEYYINKGDYLDFD